MPQVFRHLIEKVWCRLLFSTHYHPLTKEFASHPRVAYSTWLVFSNQKEAASEVKKNLYFCTDWHMGPATRAMVYKWL
jgi:DNA mismatch repair protein MSH6